MSVRPDLLVGLIVVVAMLLFRATTAQPDPRSTKRAQLATTALQAKQHFILALPAHTRLPVGIPKF